MFPLAPIYHYQASSILSLSRLQQAFDSTTLHQMLCSGEAMACYLFIGVVNVISKLN